MRRRFFAVVSIILIFVAIVAGTQIPSTRSFTGIGGGTVTTPPSPRIVSVDFDKKSVVPGQVVTITIKAINDGENATAQQIWVGFPNNPPVSDIQLVSWDGYGITILGPGVGMQESACGPVYDLTTSYSFIIAQHGLGYGGGWPKGLVETLVITVRFPDVDTFAFDVNMEGWNAAGISCYPTTGMYDQRDALVTPYLIFKRFQVSAIPGTPTEVNLSITNHNRHTIRQTQQNLTAQTFELMNAAAFPGTITAENLPLVISPGSTEVMRLRIEVPSGIYGTYDISYKVTGLP